MDPLSRLYLFLCGTIYSRRFGAIEKILDDWDVQARQGGAKEQRPAGVGAILERVPLANDGHPSGGGLPSFGTSLLQIHQAASGKKRRRWHVRYFQPGKRRGF